jgi:hypothetical protein
MVKSGYRPPCSDANGRDLCANSGFHYRALQLNRPRERSPSQGCEPRSSHRTFLPVLLPRPCQPGSTRAQRATARAVSFCDPNRTRRPEPNRQGEASRGPSTSSA